MSTLAAAQAATLTLLDACPSTGSDNVLLRYAPATR
jgi:hypothetical protein